MRYFLQSFSFVCVQNLAHENGVIKCGLESLNKHLGTLAPFIGNRSANSLLLEELERAMCSSGSESINTASDPLLNARLTPLLHSITAVHAYIAMLVHVCRTSQTDIRQVSVNQWGSGVGLRVLSGLANLYQTLVWESTILINKNAEGEKQVAAAAAAAAAAATAASSTNDTSADKVSSVTSWGWENLGSYFLQECPSSLSLVILA